jgi:tetratricopeptide (TPR) repeat protein
LGADHPDVATARDNLANILSSQGKFAESESLLRVALAAREASLGDDHPHTANTRNNLAITLLGLGRPEEALPLAEQAWARRQREDVPPPARAETAFVLARVCWEAGQSSCDRERARDLASTAVELYREAGAARSAAALDVQQWLGDHRGR